jgi:L-alanine-DL-glutamate epimerase-like enolase superfamily enzyme
MTALQGPVTGGWLSEFSHSSPLFPPSASGVSVAADESCRSAADAQHIAEGGLANVLNIKLAKSGVAGALETVAIAKKHGLGLMMGGMVSELELCLL